MPRITVSALATIAGAVDAAVGLPDESGDGLRDDGRITR